MQCYADLLPPSAVTHAIVLPFIRPDGENLVVAKTSLLQIFTLTPEADAAAVDDYDDNAAAHLSLVAEYSLSGTITALASVALSAPYSKTGASALLIACKDAKLSLVEWDPDNHRIATISIHYYEGENVVHPPFGPGVKECEAVLTVDPTSRCAALKFGQRMLAILPFRQAGDELAEEEEMGNGNVQEEDGLDGVESPSLKRAATTDLESQQPQQQESPYKPSFCLPTTTLDPTLTHPLHLAFLPAYREPTLAVLSTHPCATTTTYTVLTLDLDQRASTPLLSLPNLPSELHRVFPLPPHPVGGALLIGPNILLHVDQGGKCSAIAVNEFGRKSTSSDAFPMADQSALGMKLEGCEVGPLDPGTGDLLLALRDGSLAVITFGLHGRGVGALSVWKIPREPGRSGDAGMASCVVSLRGQRIFIGSDEGDSKVLGWTKEGGLTRKRSYAQMLDHSPDANDEEDVDDDDLYGGGDASTTTAAITEQSLTSLRRTTSPASAVYRFTLQAELPSLAPINSICFGKSPLTRSDKVEFVASVGRGRASRLAFLSREIVPRDGPRVAEGVHCEGAWGVWAKGEGADEKEVGRGLLFIRDGTRTRIYDRPRASSDGNDWTERSTTAISDFEPDGPATLAIGTLFRGRRIVQVRAAEVRTYDAGLGLSQILPLGDEMEAEMEGQSPTMITTIVFADPYLLLLRADGTALALKVEERSGDIEIIEPPAESSWGRGGWVAGCLSSSIVPASSPSGKTEETMVAWLLTADGGALHGFRLPGLDEVYAAPALAFLPPVLTVDTPMRRGGRAMVREILVADLGPGRKKRRQPFLVLREEDGDVTIYEPFWAGLGWGSLRWRKVLSDAVVSVAGGAGERKMWAGVLGGRGVIYLPSSGERDGLVGGAGSFIVKEATSLPHIVGLQTPEPDEEVSVFAPLTGPSDDDDNEAGFLLADAAGRSRIFTFPHHRDVDMGNGWCVQKISVPGREGIAEEVRQVAFHEGRGVYVVATCAPEPFFWADEDSRHEKQDDISLRPSIPRSTLHLLSAKSHTLIQTVQLDSHELITALQVMPLEISERTHEHKPCVVVASAFLRGEDMPAKGAVSVFDLIDVVPDPRHSESGVRLHAIAREETKGAVTALEAWPGGLIGTAQGMKIMVRGLKEDGSCLPVAFLDAQCYLTRLRALGESGLWLLSDAWKGVWFGAWTEEPYRLSVLGKSATTRLESIHAEFLPFDGQLFLLSVDSEGVLTVMQYDPDNPKTLAGSRLLTRGAFRMGMGLPTGMTLVPSSLPGPSLARGDEAPALLYHVLVSFASGALALLTPLDEPTFRRLAALQTHLAGAGLLEHAAGLNPRAHRCAASDEGGRGVVVDGNVVLRLAELGFARRAEVSERAGVSSWGIRADVGKIRGRGLKVL